MNIYPVVNILLENKQYETRFLLFTVMKEKGLFPQKVKTYYETAAVTAIMKVFSDIGLSGYYFHFTQVSGIKRNTCFLLKNLKPVSYTHLDVYKRQIIYWAICNNKNNK